MGFIKPWGATCQRPSKQPKKNKANLLNLQDKLRIFHSESEAQASKQYTKPQALLMSFKKYILNQIKSNLPRRHLNQPSMMPPEIREPWQKQNTGEKLPEMKT